MGISRINSLSLLISELTEGSDFSQGFLIIKLNISRNFG